MNEPQFTFAPAPYIGFEFLRLLFTSQSHPNIFAQVHFIQLLCFTDEETEAWGFKHFPPMLQF